MSKSNDTFEAVALILAIICFMVMLFVIGNAVGQSPTLSDTIEKEANKPLTERGWKPVGDGLYERAFKSGNYKCTVTVRPGHGLIASECVK